MGLVMRSLMDGLRVSENFFHTGAARLGLVIAQMETKNSGYRQRRMVQRCKDFVVDERGIVRAGRIIVQHVYGEDGGDPRAATKLHCSKQDIQEALESPDADTHLAAVALKFAGDAISIPVGLNMLLQQSWGPGEPTQGDDQAIRDCCLELKPWEASILTRAATLVLLRPSKRKIHGQALRNFLKALVEDW